MKFEYEIDVDGLTLKQIEKLTSRLRDLLDSEVATIMLEVTDTDSVTQLDMLDPPWGEPFNGVDSTHVFNGEVFKE